MAESPFLGLVTGIIAALLAVFVGNGIVRDRLEINTAARIGVAGLLGLGILGTVVFLTGLLSVAAVMPACAVVVFGCTYLGRGFVRNLQPSMPSGVLPWVLFAGITILLLLRIPATLSPSLGLDWDTISHQLAMAKIWIQQGNVDYIPFMHQSNVPATANMLYMLVLPFGGQFAAKTLGVFFGIFAASAIGGLTEQRYGKNSGWWAALAVVSAPVLLWEIGTAYVDVLHGACFAVSAFFAATWLEKREDKSMLAFSAFFLAVALATKYTAIQTGGALGVAMAIAAGGAGLKAALLVGIAALAMASPWYIRNVVNTGNPVYPFFYSVFKGRNWSDANAESYSREQQQDFGIGQAHENGRYIGKDPAALPGSVVALATLPDYRGVKPNQKIEDFNPGLPFGAVGPAVLLGLLAWPFAGLKGRAAFEKTLVLCALITLVAWFFLTQQSRYIISLIIMLAPLIGGAIAKLPFRHILMAAVALQSFYSVYLFSLMPLTIVGKESLESSFEFYEETTLLNEIGKSEDVYVALYDEVRGYYLDVPYFWANPGHHTMLPYDTYTEPQQLIDGLKSLGVTHISMSLPFLDDEERARIEAGLQSPAFDDFEGVAEFRKQIVLAGREGLTTKVATFTNANGRLRSVIFKIN